MGASVVIERLREPVVGSLASLIDESEREGLRLARRLADEWASGADRFDRPSEALFAVRQAGRLVGVCGLNVDPMPAGRTSGACGTSTCRSPPDTERRA